MWLLRKYEQLQVFIPEMQSEADAIFALNNGAVIAGQKNWTQVRAAVLTMDRDWLDLKERFSITDEFVEQHREPVTNFLLRGGSAMVRALYGYLQGYIVCCLMYFIICFPLAMLVQWLERRSKERPRGVSLAELGLDNVEEA